MTVSVLERLLDVARSHPARVALCYDGSQTWTGWDLLVCAAELGRRLVEHGAGPEPLVGLLLDKSPEHVIAQLATWWAGAAFVPLDPSLPPDRLAFILRDAGLRLAVAASSRRQFLHELGVHCLEPLRRSTQGPEVQPPRLPSPDDLAYVIYTSGSTGRPKGVVVAHRGLVPMLEAQITAFGLGPHSRSLWLLRPSFDASISDVGTALLAGAVLCIEPDEALTGDAKLISVVASRGITHLDLPPAFLRRLAPSAMPGSLQTLIIGGEASPVAVVKEWAKRFHVVNVYGPTEATVCTSLCRCTPDSWDQPLVGQPLPGVVYQVVNKRLEPVPAGVPGELVIAGAGLARGYLNQPELTAAKFPIVAGRRLYRTGDRVVRRADGEYVFLGRLDRQVKVRGLLVEPEEIESRLLEHPAVEHAAVVKRPLGAGGSRREGLVAFIVPRSIEPALRSLDLRVYLGRWLPRWMIPQRFEIVPAIPRTGSGKIDYLDLVNARLGYSAETDAPLDAQTPAGQILADVCRRVLELPFLDWREGFLSQGGDSLTLLEAVTAAHARGLIVPPAFLADDVPLIEILARLGAARDDDDLGQVHKGAQPPGALSCRDLQREAADLPARRESRGGSPPVAEPHAVFLTGATGFLGCRLLPELLRRTRAEVYCLVRAADSDDGRNWLETTLARNGLVLSESQRRRVHVVTGDLTLPVFGWKSGDWDRLADHIDTVYHCGASVNLVRSYAELRTVNVLGTREVLRFLATGRAKRLHYASTLSVFVASDRNAGRLYENDDLASTRWVYGGYAQSKWAAEWLLRAAAGTAGPVVHYRLGLITGDSRTGQAGREDYLGLFCRGLARLRCVPPMADSELFLDVTPVDFAAAAMAYLSLQPAAKADGTTFHLANPRSLALGEMLRALSTFGVRIETVSGEQWRHRLAELQQGDPDAALACLALCRLLPGNAAYSSYRTMDLFQATGVEFDMHNARAALSGSGLHCPQPSQELLARYLACVFAEERP